MPDCDLSGTVNAVCDVELRDEFVWKVAADRGVKIDAVFPTQPKYDHGDVHLGHACNEVALVRCDVSRGAGPRERAGAVFYAKDCAVHGSTSGHTGND